MLEELLRKIYCRREESNLTRVHIGKTNSPGEVITINESFYKVSTFFFYKEESFELCVCKERNDPGGGADGGSKDDRCEQGQWRPWRSCENYLSCRESLPMPARLTDENVSVSDT